MDNSVYGALTRQNGLVREMRLIANNIANAATTGYRQESIMFSEHLQDNGAGGLSTAHANIARTDHHQGALHRTGNSLDLALEGGGFMAVETPLGTRLTRAGSFMLSPEGEVINASGHKLLDQSQSPIFLPPNSGEIAIAVDGTLSVGGEIFSSVGVVVPEQIETLAREDGVVFSYDGELIPDENTRLLQSHLEKSNTNPVQQIARMIEVQRAYELGQSFLEKESERQKNATKSIIP